MVCADFRTSSEKPATDIRDTYGWTPLHCALIMGHCETASLLIEHGADVHARSGNLSTTLQLAARHKECEQLALQLLEMNVEVDVLDSLGNSALHNAAWFGCWRLLPKLLEKGVDPNEKKSTNGQTPLHLVLDWGFDDDPTPVEALLQYGADTTLRDMYEGTPSAYGLASSKFKGLEVLIRHEVGLRKQDFPQNLSLNDKVQVGVFLCSLYPEDMMLPDHLARAYLKSGRIEEGFNIFESVLAESCKTENIARLEEIHHKSARCNKCGTWPLQGLRYCCVDCTQFDLCEYCYNSSNIFLHGSETDHKFFQIPTDEWIKRMKEEWAKQET